MFLPIWSRTSISKCSSVTAAFTISLLLFWCGSARATTIVVPSGGDLQAAINIAQRGDTIVVQATTFNILTPDTGLVLPVKSGSFNGSNFITIQSANLASLPSASTRVSPADVANMPSLVVTRPGTPVITVASGASGYQLIGLEIKNNLTGTTSGDITNSMVNIAYTANNIVFDRLLVHPNEHPTLANNWLTRGKAAFSDNGSYITLKNSYVYDFFGRDPVDSQLTNGSAQQTEAFYISPTSDHTTLDNNFLEAWYAVIQTAGSDGIASSVQTVLASPAPTLSAVRLSSVAGLSVGMMMSVDLPHSTDPTKCKQATYGDRPCWAVGKVASVNPSTGDVTFSPDLITVNQSGNRVVPYAMPSVPGAAIWAGTQPSDITVTHNTMNLPVDFSAYHKATNGAGNKGIIETKSVLGFTFEGNIITGYPGSLALTTVNQNGGCPWCTTANVTIRNNWFQSYRDVSLLSLTDYSELATQGHDILIENNLATNRDASDGSCVRIGGAATNVIVRHNTCVGGYPNNYTGVSFLAGEPANGAPATIGGTLPYYPVLDATGIIIRDNLADAGNYTATCYRNADNGGGSRFLGCFNSPTQDHNMFALNVPGADPLYQFPSTTNKVASSWTAVLFTGNSYSTLTDWRLQAVSPGYRAASDGTDIGVNIDQLNQALFGTGAPAPSPTPTPSSTPTASPTPTPIATPTPTPTPIPTPTPTPTPLTTSIISPTTNATYSLGSSVTITANASDTAGNVTNLTFKANSQAIGSDTASPYTIAWSNMAAGTYTVTATAQDDAGLIVTSAPITVKISRTVKRVRGVKNSTQTLSNAISSTQPSLAQNSGQTSALTTLVADLDQTYSDFLDEKAMFPAATVIEKYLFAASFLARTSASLSAQQTPASAVSDRLKKINSYLSFCEDLMVDGVISSSTVSSANKVNAQVNLSIYQPETMPVGSLGFNVMPNGTARITSVASHPFSTQTTTASGGGSFELADVGVTFGGEATRVLSVSPTELTVVVPSDLSAGIAEIVVSSREGFILRGAANVAGLNPRLFDTYGRGIVLDSFSQSLGPFPATPSIWIGLDAQTRLSIIATGISSGLSNSDVSNDVWLSDGRLLENLSENVFVLATTADGRSFWLKVEYAGAQGQLPGIDQINVVLPPQLAGAGTAQLRVYAGNSVSNIVTISLN